MESNQRRKVFDSYVITAVETVLLNKQLKKQSTNLIILKTQLKM
jgi:hypothetical protein